MTHAQFRAQARKHHEQLGRRPTFPEAASPGARDGARAWEVQGPVPHRPVVQAWTDEYIRFERRPLEQERLRAELRNRIRELKAGPGQLLHATYFGPKWASADVENLVLYNVDDTGRSFHDAARFGLRFELAPQPPISPSGKGYTYSYRYELADWLSGFRHWRQSRELASWDWIDLAKFRGEKKLEQIWLALSRAPIDVASPGRGPDVAFAVYVAIRPPRGYPAVLGYFLKGIIDGVVCAFQAHTNRADVGELAARVSRVLPAAADEIEALLLDQDKAVLGIVQRLLHKRGDGVQWAPADDLCVAGELVAAEPTGSAWAIQGRLVQVEPG